MTETVLVLNACFTPLKIVSAERALTLWFQGKVEVVQAYDRMVRSPRQSFALPSVVRLLQFVKLRRRQVVPFTRQNLYARDNYRCAYCETVFTADDLTFDHVVPVAQGGQRGWENITTACVPCNRKKGARTPAQAGMHLARQPRRPIVAPTLKAQHGYAPQHWSNWLFGAPGAEA